MSWGTEQIGKLSFVLFQLTDILQVSMELGCFLAGVMISAQGPELSVHAEHVIQPIRDFLGCVFFVSLGKSCLIEQTIRYAKENSLWCLPCLSLRLKGVSLLIALLSGLHVFPSFMGYELTYLTTFTFLTVTLKVRNATIPPQTRPVQKIQNLVCFQGVDPRFGEGC